MFFLFLFPNLQENYLFKRCLYSHGCCFVLHRIFYGSKRTGAAAIEKRKRKFESCMICAGILFAAFAVLSRTDNAVIQEAGISAAKIIAGEGMQRLVREDQGQTSDCPDL